MLNNPRGRIKKAPFNILRYLLYLSQFLGYVGPIYHFGILKVSSLSIDNGFNGFFQIRETMK